MRTLLLVLVALGLTACSAKPTDKPKAGLDRAEQLYRDKRYEEAAAAYDRLPSGALDEAAREHYPEVLRAVALGQCRSGRGIEGTRTLEKLARLFPKEPEHQHAMERAVQATDPHEAFYEASLARAFWPQEPEVIALQLSMARRSLEPGSLALFALTVPSDSFTALPEAERKLLGATCLSEAGKQTEPKRQLALFNLAVTLQPKDPEAHYQRGRYHYLQGALAESLADIRHSDRKDFLALLELENRLRSRAGSPPKGSSNDGYPMYEQYKDQWFVLERKPGLVVLLQSRTGDLSLVETDKVGEKGRWYHGILLGEGLELLLPGWEARRPVKTTIKKTEVSGGTKVVRTEYWDPYTRLGKPQPLYPAVLTPSGLLVARRDPEDRPTWELDVRRQLAGMGTEFYLTEKLVLYDRALKRAGAVVESPQP